MAWGWAGGWRRWKCLSQSSPVESQTWEEQGAITGHRGAVQGLNWTKGGEYLISTGRVNFQNIYLITCLFECEQTGPDDPDSRQYPSQTRRTGVWREIGRPQVHGYDLEDAVFLHERKFVSIADEKVARVFEAPKRFLGLCKHFGLLDVEMNKVYG